MSSNELFFEDPLLSEKISDILKEKEIELISSIIDVMGGQFTIMILEKVQQVLSSGGIEKKKGGVRSPGGTFFALVREYASEVEVKKIFQKQTTERKRRSRARKRILKKVSKLNLNN